MTDKTAFYWAIIGDSAPEPVAVTGEPGARLAYTIGCPDPFEVDVPDTNIELLRPRELDPIWNEKDHSRYYVAQGYTIPEPEPMEFPKLLDLETLKVKRAEAEERLAEERRRGKSHGYAGFGARASIGGDS